MRIVLGVCGTILCGTVRVCLANPPMEGGLTVGVQRVGVGGRGTGRDLLYTTHCYC